MKQSLTNSFKTIHTEDGVHSSAHRKVSITHTATSSTHSESSKLDKGEEYQQYDEKYIERWNIIGALN